MPGFVGTAAPRYYYGVVTSAAAPDCVVRISDDTGDGEALDLTVRGSATPGELVTIMVPPSGVPILIRS